MELLIELVRKYQSARTDEERNRYASEILARIYPRLSLFIQSRVQNANTEDVLQEIFKAIFTQLSFFRGQSGESFLSWVYTIARCKAADSFRGRKTNQSTVADPKILEEALAHLRVEGTISDDDLSDLHDALDLLKAADYPCLGWLWDRFVIGLTLVQMGEKDGITDDAARKRVKRCLELAEKLINK